MKKYFKEFFVLAGITTAVVLFLQGSVHAVAQTLPPQLLVNWQASSYAPDAYAGKVLPTSESQIVAGVDLFDQGKHIDLSIYKVYWYINNNFYQGGVGMNRITITAPRFIGDTNIQLRVSIQDYGNGPGKTVTIPIVVPQIVIQSSAPSLSAAATPFNLRVYPYFFNIQNPSDLLYSWSINNTRVSLLNPFVVTREMAQQGQTTVQVSVSNPNKIIERTVQSLTLFRQ